MSGIIKKKLAWNFLRPGVDLIKHFRSKFTHSFCKLDHFITVNNIVSVQLKYLAYEIVQVILRPKGFKRLTPGRAKIRIGLKMLTVVRWIVKRTKVMAHSSKNLESPNIIYITSWLTFYFFYLSNLFEILRCPFQWSILNPCHFLFPPTLHLSPPLICSSLFLSFPLLLTPHSVFTCLHFI